MLREFIDGTKTLVIFFRDYISHVLLIDYDKPPFPGFLNRPCNRYIFFSSSIFWNLRFHPVSTNSSLAGKWGPRIESMYFLLNIGISDCYVIVYRRVFFSRSLTASFAPEKLPKPNRKLVFQQPFFRGELLNLGGVFFFPKHRLIHISSLSWVREVGSKVWYETNQSKQVACFFNSKWITGIMIEMIQKDCPHMYILYWYIIYIYIYIYILYLSIYIYICCMYTYYIYIYLYLYLYLLCTPWE